ncbi:23S rRNA pseudouridine(955/2504/2580) synthase RluC [Acidithiobacillus acidisediminis]|uniref:23S rRNA pseudouridine(955/2504/2580) synthase RluC n=1 Tax=Acidithiobacillus acidisediminis TaxID=2937799 RepID=UPI00200BFB43|nr:23S rRNA pseudouridine(955/2504/2580) synthase RluC [Acidithiobacillus sp. S30A2]
MVESGVRYLDIGEAEAGQRLDNFLLRVMKGVPRSHIYKILRSGEVRVNKGRVKAQYHLTTGDQVRLPPLRQAEPSPSPTVTAKLADDLRARILYEDERVLVLDKPSGLAVHGGSGIAWGVIEALRALRPDIRELELVHRLDRETSGCLLLSKRRSALRQLHAEIREGGMQKRYLVLAAGAWRGGEQRVDLPLRKNTLRSGERIVCVDKGMGKAAATRFSPLQRFANCTLLEAELESGRTHQIRVHLQAIGHPVLGDEKYGDPDANAALRETGLRRLFLHASLLCFTHPGDQRVLRVEAPLSANLQVLLEDLARRDGRQGGQTLAAS